MGRNGYKEGESKILLAGVRYTMSLHCKEYNRDVVIFIFLPVLGTNRCYQQAIADRHYNVIA